MKFIFGLLLPFIFSISIFSQQSNTWETEFEKSNYIATSSYKETIDYLVKIESKSEYCKMLPLGESPEGRTLYAIIADKDKRFSPTRLEERDKAVIMVLCGIHSGEIEGKDASLLLLRDILIDETKFNLLENVTLVIVPIFNVDGHERKSPYNRINQNGPREMGWRTTAQNLNLNRDFTKADSPEMKYLLKLYSSWLPDFFIDTHTTDGADYQYTITYAIETHQNLYSGTTNWIKNSFLPFAEKYVVDKGFLISPYVSYVDNDFRNGVTDWVATPRFSNGYTTIQNRPGLLIETHMLKQYKERVFSTKALLEASLTYINKNNLSLIDLNKSADLNAVTSYLVNKKYYPLKLKVEKENPDSLLYKGYSFKYVESKVAGGKIKKYTNKKLEKKVPYYNKAIVTDSVKMPNGYIIPKEFSNLVNIIKLHGILIDTIRSNKNFVVEQYKFTDVKFANYSYESHQRVDAKYYSDTLKCVANKGDFYVSCDQRGIGVIAHLLEPLAEDSFLKWGMLNSIFEPKEYFESYSMEPIAQVMYENDSTIKQKFDNKVNSDSSFASSQRNRLNFFYKRSKYFDRKLNVYPFLRVIK